MADEKSKLYPIPNIEDAERELFQRFIDKLADGRYDECHKITGLMERLSLI